MPSRFLTIIKRRELYLLVIVLDAVRFLVCHFGMLILSYDLLSLMAVQIITVAAREELLSTKMMVLDKISIFGRFYA